MAYYPNSASTIFTTGALKAQGYNLHKPTRWARYFRKYLFKEFEGLGLSDSNFAYIVLGQFDFIPTALSHTQSVLRQYLYSKGSVARFVNNFGFSGTETAPGACDA